MLESIRVTEKLHWPKTELSKKSILSLEVHKLNINNENSLQHPPPGILKDIFTTGTSSYNVLLQSKEEKKHHAQKQPAAHHKKHRKAPRCSAASRGGEQRKIPGPLPLLSGGWYRAGPQPSGGLPGPGAAGAKLPSGIAVSGGGAALPSRPRGRAKRHLHPAKPKHSQSSRSPGKEGDAPGQKLCLLTAIKPCNVEQEKEKFFKSDFTYNPQFEYANPALPNVLAKHSHASDRFLKQSINIMERTLQKYGSYERFEQATGGSLLTKSRIWNHVRKYMVKEGCLGEIVVHLTEDLLSRASMTVVNGRPTLTINISTAREHWLEGMLRHEIGCFNKDQVYLDGILRILRYRESIDFHLLTALGKISYEDVERLKGLAVTENRRVPHFLQDHARYMEHLQKIMDVNELTDEELQDLIN
ncbi:putative tyrosine carboxypeptidase MATCAP2 isoform X3 [Dryobates pubescens]|uniref:putative tyrosine carboxypeptidase MATCAP2 isoform X3 n=1 Tax=Dryobates pubescens TaxID=118200 RepID=UPI0023B8F432|nr:putative tyrosine carboxypeptidase MATCAP2 isoform X3 [Dryobates pubescens]